MRWLLILVLLSGCATTKEVQVAVPTKPKIEKPEKPKKCIPKDQSDTEFTRCEFIDLNRLREYVPKLEAILGSLL